MRDLLGGKGANVAEMTRILGPERVPGGFTITTEACVAYMREDAFPDGLRRAGRRGARGARGARGQEARRRRRPAAGLGALGRARVDAGDARHRPEPRPQRRVGRGAGAKTGNERFAWDSYRRFVQMFGNVVRGIEGKRFEDEIKRVKADRGVKDDTELDVEALQELTRSFKELYDFPSDPREQLEQAIRAVFDSWIGERAVTYRRINRIPDDWGTAVNVQQMVFGNKGDSSGSGVAFSRDEVTGAPEPCGDFLINAQGEDVVSGRAQHARHLRARDAAARGPRPADGDPARARAPLRRHAGHGVHGRGRPPVHAADAQRQAPGAGGGALRGRRGRRGPARQGAGADDDRRREARRAAAPDLRPGGRVRRARLGRGRLAGRGERRDRLHRRRRGGRRRPTVAT